MNDTAIALLETYAHGRADEKALLRQVRALRCEHATRTRGEEDPEQPCYLSGSSLSSGDIPKWDWCNTCKRRDPLFLEMVARKRANRALLRRLEAAALQQPEPAQADEPKPLLDLMCETGP